MIKKYTMGKPIRTYAVTKDFDSISIDAFPLNHRIENERFIFELNMAQEDIVYGLGEAPRGINKRGWIYESYCSDDPFHTETKSSLYGAHNFIMLYGSDCFGIFVDFPGRVIWDIGYSAEDKAVVTAEGTDLDIYLIKGEKPIEVVKEFRGAIGKSYIPPLWAFGYQQSRWSYHNADAVDRVIESYNKSEIPLDCVYLDIDYMERFKDFTVDKERFPDFSRYVKEKKAQGIHLIPIIDAGIKKEDGYDIYEEALEKGYFCKTAQGEIFECGVWPGIVGLPDFMRQEVRDWFGSKYRLLIDLGIDGFWNDMNEPAIFYSKKELDKAIDKAVAIKDQNLDLSKFFELKDTFAGLSNKAEDYSSIYHTVDGEQVCHNRVHNIYGSNMTRAAGEYFERNFGSGRMLLFSRASYIGAHRTSGIWFGDNHSWWSHILLCLKMLPSVNMCGFLYCGADLGGFNGNATRDLVLRFLALGVFTPLMRNHSALGTRDQECYSFEGTEDFRDIVLVRYRLIPYLYRAFCRASEEDDMLFRPLSFDYPRDKIARQCETQLMLSKECMICPVYEQNARGRTVYLPEDMTFVKLRGKSVSTKEMTKGIHYVDVALNEVPLFIKKGMQIPLCPPALRTNRLDADNVTMVP